MKNVLLTVVVLLCSISVSAHSFEVDGIYYKITSTTDNTVSVTYKGDNDYSYKGEYMYDVVIPESVVANNGRTYSVTSIDDGAFKECIKLTSVIIPNSVTSIGRGAFEGCSSLFNISFGKSITSIGGSAFRYCTSLTSITIPESVMSIESGLFAGCTSLEEIVIPNTVTSIGSSAFENTPWYNQQPDGVVYVNDVLYKYKGEMPANTAIVVREGTVSITAGAFRNYNGLISITIPSSMQSISEGSMTGNLGNGAFYGCQYLKTIINFSDLNVWKGSTDYGHLADYATRVINADEQIGDFYFSTIDNAYHLIGYLKNERKVTLPNNYKGENYAIGENAFFGCDSITSITIPNTVISVGVSAFSGCANLTSIAIPNSVTSIDLSAFYGTNLQSLTMGIGVTSITGKFSNSYNVPAKVIWLTNTPPSGYANVNGKINYVANEQYSDLKNVKVYPYLSSMFEVDGVKYVPVNMSERSCDVIDAMYDSSVENVNIGPKVSYRNVEMNVKEVMPYAFYKNSSVKSLTLANQDNVGDYAFEWCTGIKTAEITNNGGIGMSAFYGCDSLVSVLISNAGDIEQQAFRRCYSLQTAMITNKGEIGLSSFSDCTSLTSVTIGDEVDRLGTTAFSGCSLLAEITIPHSVLYAGSECFSGCNSLERATIGDGLYSISEAMFKDCSSLREVNIGNKVTEIKTNAFSGCSKLQSIQWGKSVKKIGEYAFNNCSGMSAIVIPQSVTSISNNAFNGCTSLVDVIIEDRTDALNLGYKYSSSPLFADCPLDSVYIGGKITYNTSSKAGYSPFYNNVSLRTVVISDKEVAVYDNEFYNCSGLKSVVIGNGVKSIGNWSFSGCRNLEQFTFGISVESIGQEAFSDCISLTQLISSVDTPPTCGTQALEDINKWNCTLKVPIGCASLYQVADQWKDFFFVEDVVEIKRSILTYVVDGEVYATDTLICGTTISVLEEPTKLGYTFSGWDEVPETMPNSDITISGTFNVNIYQVYYFVNEELVHVADVAYGDSIPEYVYTSKEGDVVNEWIGDYYCIMPPKNISYKADMKSGIDQLIIDKEELMIYDITGRRVLNTENLKSGIYIINGKKVLIE